MRKLTIGKRIVYTIICLWLVGASLLVFLAYRNTERALADNIRTLVRDYASLGAMILSGEDHARLRIPADEGTEEYGRVIADLRGIRDINADIRFVYTMRKAGDGRVVFVADAEEDETERSHIGDVYEDATPLLQEAVGGHGGAVIEPDFSTDQWGRFLSAYAPVLLSDGTFECVLGVDISAGSVQKKVWGMLWPLLGFLFFITVLLLPVSVFLSRSIVVGLKACVVYTGFLAAGDFSRKLPEEFRTRGDEIGDLARAFHAMVGNIRALLTSMSDNVRILASSATGLSAVSEQTAESVLSMSAKTSTVAAAAEESSANTASVAAGMEQTSTNLETVASATEEISATIGEIASNSEKARSISSEAAGQAASVSALMRQLGKAAQDIGKVTETITGISSQTNLLALNATIEAARAGTAGKGFAVVANEIKELAKQTSAATEDIKAKIGEVQSSTGSAIADIEKITAVIQQVEQLVSVIATAIDEQAAVTRDAAENIAQASVGIREANERVNQTVAVSCSIAHDIAGVDTAAGEIREIGAHVRSSAAVLSELAEQLKGLVEKFKVEETPHAK